MPAQTRQSRARPVDLRVNLCFHGVGTPGRELEPGEVDYWTSRSTFLRVLDLVVDRDDVRLSFDDGNASDVTEALPALQERGLDAAFFLIAGRLGASGSVSVHEAQALVAAGMEVGSHGLHHRAWRGLEPPVLEEELDEARALLTETLGVDITTAACPFGLYDRRTIAGLRSRGYTRVMTSDRAVARSGGWLQPRFSVRAQDDVASVAVLLETSTALSRRISSHGRILLKSLR